jgi:hypothetical protein
MGATLSDRRSVREATVGQSQVGLPLIGEARTDRAPTLGQNTDGDWILPLIKRAQERSMSQKDAVITMGIAKTQYIENLQGVGHLSVRKLGMLPQAFWEALADELRAHFQLDNDTERLDRALDGLASCVKVIGEIARKGLR